jgi:hypothetical protein
MRGLEVVPQAAGTQVPGAHAMLHSIPALIPALMRRHSRLQVPKEPVQARRYLRNIVETRTGWGGARPWWLGAG